MSKNLLEYSESEGTLRELKSFLITQVCENLNLSASFRESFLRFQVMNGLRSPMLGMLVIRNSETQEQRGLLSTTLSRAFLYDCDGY